MEFPLGWVRSSFDDNFALLQLGAGLQGLRVYYLAAEGFVLGSQGLGVGLSGVGTAALAGYTVGSAFESVTNEFLSETIADAACSITRRRYALRSAPLASRQIRATGSNILKK